GRSGIASRKDGGLTVRRGQRSQPLDSQTWNSNRFTSRCPLFIPTSRASRESETNRSQHGSTETSVDQSQRFKLLTGFEMSTQARALREPPAEVTMTALELVFALEYRMPFWGIFLAIVLSAGVSAR